MHVKIWDLPTRLFHWTLVALVAFELLSGFAERAPGGHAVAGYTLIALLLFRLVWGFWGPGPNRFADFVHGPAAIIGHLRAVLTRAPMIHLGHNPAGGAMIIALLVTLAALTLTGLVTLGGQEGLGPLAAFIPYEIGHAAKELHEGLAALLMALVAGHVTGVAVESLLLKENLVSAMITGLRRRRPDAIPPLDRPARPGVALGVLILLAGVLIPSAFSLASLPPHGWRALAANPVYDKNCGDCHWAFHPSLLPAASWQRLMGELGDHFGENAELSPADQQAVAAWLRDNALESWDTKASHRLATVDAQDPTRVTAAPGWKKRHHDLAKELFARPKVGSRANCPACHQDAPQGRFTARAIHIPKE